MALRKRWYIVIGSEVDGLRRDSGSRWRFWLMLAMALLGIAATLAVGTGWFRP